MRHLRVLALSDSSFRPRMHCLWIAWHAHRRTAGLCAEWGVPLRVVGPARRGPATWAVKTLRTFWLLVRERPDVLFVPNPSLGLTLFVYLARPVFGFFLVVDAHNEGVRPFDRPGSFVRWLTRCLLRGADATIVTNEALALDVTDAGGRALVLSDSLPVPPALSPPEEERFENAPQIVVIATFRPDEPIAAIVEAVATMPDVEFLFTGDAARFERLRVDLPPNARLTGFLPDPEYWSVLARADVVCDLTLKPDCLVCGAYESLALAKPMVLSDDRATGQIFGPAAVLTRSEPSEIAEAFAQALDRRDELGRSAVELREAYRTRWQPKAAAVWEAIHAEARTARAARA